MTNKCTQRENTCFIGARTESYARTHGEGRGRSTNVAKRKHICIYVKPEGGLVGTVTPSAPEVQLRKHEDVRSLVPGIQ